MSPNVWPPTLSRTALFFHGAWTWPGSRDINLNNYLEYEVKLYLDPSLTINGSLSGKNDRFLLSNDAAEAHIFFKIQGIKKRAAKRIRQDHKL